MELQDNIIRRHLEAWLETSGEREIRDSCRDMNQMTSQEVFVGPYLDDPEVKAKFGKAYRDITDAFLAFPVCLPGTAVWRGRQGRLYILSVLARCAERAVAHIRAGGEPRCLMDFWAARCLQEIAEAEAAGVAAPPHTSMHRMADAMLDFLFASQDASTASLTWCLTQMCERPDVLARVREEQAALRPDPAATISGEVLGQMTYTRQVVKELLRWRPPAPMVPSYTYADYALTPDYVVPKGTMIMPSIVAANTQGFPNGEAFDPDRFGEERKEDIKYAKNFLTFGFGPHYCVGQCGCWGWGWGSARECRRLGVARERGKGACCHGSSRTPGRAERRPRPSRSPIPLSSLLVPATHPQARSTRSTS